MINWKVRFKNRLWVSGFISQIFIVIQIVLVGLHSMGVTDFQLSEDIQAWILTLVNAVFVVLSTIGLVQDPSVEGIEDSYRTMAKDEPSPNIKRKNNTL